MYMLVPWIKAKSKADGCQLIAPNAACAMTDRQKSYYKDKDAVYRNNRNKVESKMLFGCKQTDFSTPRREKLIYLWSNSLVDMSQVCPIAYETYH